MKPAAVGALAFAACITLAAAGPRTFVVDPARSRALIEVGKTGAFSFAGHTHEVGGAAAMRVTGAGDPPDDVPKVTGTMLGAQVLDVKRFPSIAFESTGASVKGALPSLDLQVAGRLTIHGVTRPVAAPVAVRVDGDALTATGSFAIRQTDFGIKPISIGGLVKVRDELHITFTIAARER